MNINVGNSAPHKSFHDLSHNVNTSSNFGFVQPILQRELIAQDSVSLRVGQIVRLTPLNSPTFGSIELKTYNSFVTIEDIWHPFPSFKLGKAYRGATGHTYIPENVPQIYSYFFWELLMLDSTVWVYDDANQQGSNDITYDPDNDTFITATSAIQDEFGHDILEVFPDISFSFELFRQRLYALGYQEHITDLTLFGAPSSVQGVANLDGFDWVFRGDNYIFCGRYNRSARLIRKVLLGLGYQLNSSPKPLSILPLVAYYKAYFDIFAVQRDKTWKDTNAYGMMEWLEQTGHYNLDDAFVSADSTADVKAAVAGFFADLADCFYTINPDYASAHITGVSTSSAKPGIVQYLDVDGNSIGEVSKGGVYQQVYINSDGGGVNGSVGRDIQDRMTIFLNKVTAIGGRVGVAMRALYHEDYDGYDSVYLGSQKLPIEIGPVFATNDSDQVELGDYAGQGIGTTAGTKLQFIAKKQGYLISMCTIVPEAKMSQGVDPMLFHTKRWDFYNDKFDARTLLPTAKMAIYGHQEVLIKSVGADSAFASGFGNIPNYTEYKIKNNINNGDVSLPSTRTTYQGFNLDKLLPYRNAHITIPGGKVQSMHPLPLSIITAGDFWRYIGKYNWFGNFDRIFRNSGKADDTYFRLDEDLIDDNFIIQCFVSLKIHSFAKPLADSFETGENEQSTIDVQKA